MAIPLERYVKVQSGRSRTRTITTGSSIIPAIPPIRVISVQNRINTLFDNVSGKLVQCFRWPHFIASTSSEMVLAVNNWIMAAGTSNEVNPGNTVNILEMSVEGPGGVVVPVTFGGSRSKILMDGETKVLSDAIPASAFGAQNVTAGLIYYIKGKIEVPSGGRISANVTAAGDASTQAIWFNPANATPSATDAAGVYTFTGTGLDYRQNGFYPYMLGRPLVDLRSLIVIGDSISASVNDNVAWSIGGLGFVQRAVYNGGANTVPCLNFSVSGIVSFAFGNGTKWRQYIQYAKNGMDELGTNDIGTTDGATLLELQTRCNTNWTTLLSGGVAKILRTKLLVRTTTTDNWSTAINQIEVSGWTPGGKSMQFNAWLDTKKADGTLADVVNMNSVRDGTTPTKWLTNGSPKFVNSDDVHPIANGHALMATELNVSFLANLI